jgi:transcriptional regulator with XRE-family HTH domain
MVKKMPKVEYLYKIKKVVNEILLRHCISQKEFCKLTGIKQSHMSNILHGGFSVGIETRKKILLALENITEKPLKSEDIFQRISATKRRRK